MKLHIRVYGHLERWNNHSLEWTEIETKHTRMEDILRERGFPLEEVCFLVKEGEFIDMNDPIAEGDWIELVPPIAGG